MAQFVVLQDFVASNISLTAGDRVDDTALDLASLKRAGLAVAPITGPEVEAAIVAYLAQRDQGLVDVIPMGSMLALALQSEGGASLVGTSTGQSVEDRLGGGGGGPPSGPAGGQLGDTYPNPSVVGLTETSGPTPLTMGDVPDGQVLTRDGSTIVGSTGAGGPPTGIAGGQLGGTYPNPNVTGVTETSGPTGLDIGAIADGQLLVRSGAEVVGQTGAAPSGAAGGQLSGTYPNPDVAGITETSGPTALTAGAIADGQLVARSGSALVGQSGAAPVGAASGQLGGTYPSPSVEGITETSGPTALAIGPIADQQVLIRSGGLVIGSPGATPVGLAGGQLGGTYPNPTVIAVTESSGPDALGIGAIADGQLVARSGGALVGQTGAAPSGAASGQLSGSYPSPSVVGVTESAGPDALTVGAIADGQVVARSGASLIGQAGAAPVGSAGGQLSGTYPDPDVAGITETSGPTALAIGAVADGEFLQRSGSSIIGAAGGGGPPSGPAGGQLSGTYPNPSVSGLTETLGPTALTMGPVADGQVLSRFGSTIVGIPGGGGSVPIPYIDGFVSNATVADRVGYRLTGNVFGPSAFSGVVMFRQMYQNTANHMVFGTSNTFGSAGWALETDGRALVWRLYDGANTQQVRSVFDTWTNNIIIMGITYSAAAASATISFFANGSETTGLIFNSGGGGPVTGGDALTLGAGRAEGASNGADNVQIIGAGIVSRRLTTQEMGEHTAACINAGRFEDLQSGGSWDAAWDVSQNLPGPTWAPFVGVGTLDSIGTVSPSIGALTERVWKS